MNISSTSPFGGSSASGSSSGGSICALVPIISLKAVHDNDNLLVNDTLSVLIEKDVDRLYNHYQISQELFWVHAPNPRIHMDDQILTENTIIVYEKQLKVGLRFSIDPFFIEVIPFP